MVLNCKSKGGSYERSLAKKLSLWWTGNERDDVIWRTQSSGGRFTQRAKKGQDTQGQQGDLTCTDPIAKPLTDLLSIEAKRGYSKLDILNHIDGKNTEFETLWNQCVGDADKCNKNPMLILKRDRKSELVFLEKSFFNVIIDYRGFPVCRTLELAYNDKPKIIGMKLYYFLEWCNPETIRSISNVKKNETEIGKG